MGIRQNSGMRILLALLSAGCLMGACGKKDDARMKESVQEAEEPLSGDETERQWETGYDIPLEKQEETEAENDCMEAMNLISGIYEEVEKGTAFPASLDEETLGKMQKKLTETGCPVTVKTAYADMENHAEMDGFLCDCMDAKSGFAVVYAIGKDGGIERLKFEFDGSDMYVTAARSVWNREGEPGISYVSRAAVMEWEYTTKGWFCWRICVPEPPEVSEIMDGSCLIRVKPMEKELRELSEKCVRGLGYQGNNLLCSDWDEEHMEKLDYNGIYEYLYAMKYGTEFPAETYADGIPKEEFESLIMEYLPVTAGQIRAYAVFDGEKQTYSWVRLGCFNYAPTFFGTALPEVTDIRENTDGTVTLTVDAVCDTVICDDALITHKLTVKFEKDGSFRYLGNEIAEETRGNLPEYQYRVGERN